MTSTSTTDAPASATRLPKLPPGARGILPTIWCTFVVTVVLALTFSFGNVWDLGRRLGVEKHVAPLIGPAVDFTAMGLLVVVPWLVLAGVDSDRLKPATRLMRLAGVLTLALNSSPAAIKGWTDHDPAAWGRAGVEAIVPLLLIAWSHVGPMLVALFAEAREHHRERVEAILRASVESSTEAAQRRVEEIAEAVEEALRGASVEWRAQLAEADSRRAEVEAAAQLAEDAHRASMEAVEAKVAQMEAKLARLRGGRVGASTKTSRRATTKSVEADTRAPRKTSAELLEERVEAAKEALPTWQLETPSGPEIGSALGLKSEGTISEIRKRIEADRLTLAAGSGTS